jgi:two-component sensor histidine kinase
MPVARGRVPRETEIDVNGTVVQLRSIPLVVGGQRTGALVLVRDVTELRRRERELLTKEATIREIHHRVKNNLQTVAALLRLQARRLQAPEARAALEEAVRRVGSIAIVHETLSHTPEEIVDFDGIADRVAMMAGEVSSPEVRVTPKITGQFGMLPSVVATPLAMVLTELLQNALQHGFGTSSRSADGMIEVVAARAPEQLTVTVTDSGAGLPPGFDLENTTSLGLQIVRTLVEGELGGRLILADRPGGGTVATIDLPVRYEPMPRPSLGRRLYPGGPGDRGPRALRQAQTAARARSRTVRRLSARRSSSLRPPQTPASWPLSMAQRRHSSSTLHRRQTCLASSICRTAGPLFPIGKNSSGSASRQAAMFRQSMVSTPSRRSGRSSVAAARHIVLVKYFTSHVI